jgi:hypothetical protein
MDVVRTFLALSRWEALVLAARHAPSPHLPHRFTPRRHGSKSACEVCGGRSNDEIHTDRQPAEWPKRGAA